MSYYKELLNEFITKKREQQLPLKLRPNKDGIVFIGGELTVPNVIEAYVKGCFPWGGEDPITWHCPNPRPIIIPSNFHASKSLTKLIKQDKYTIRFDTNFRNVMLNCASIKRKRQHGTWINDTMLEIYCSLFDLNIAHSVEVYDSDQSLIGGLYGLTFGKAFFGESMFSNVPNSSKLALYSLCKFMTENNFLFIDCQQVTHHIISLGAIVISRQVFMNLLFEALKYESYHERWVSSSKGSILSTITNCENAL